MPTETDTERQTRTGLSSLRMSDDASKAVQKTVNRVALDDIEKKIVSEEVWHPTNAPHMTIMVLQLENGYMVVGKSTPADPENFNAALGRQFAYEDAIRQIWPLEAYLLREAMSL